MPAAGSPVSSDGPAPGGDSHPAGAAWTGGADAKPSKSSASEPKRSSVSMFPRFAQVRPVTRAERRGVAAPA